MFYTNKWLTRFKIKAHLINHIYLSLGFVGFFLPILIGYKSDPVRMQEGQLR